MKKIILIQSVLLTSLIIVSPAFAAQSGDITKIQSFMQNIIQVFVTLSGLVATGFFVYGGIGYITSSGNPEALEKSKRTIIYSSLGLAIVLGAFVISNIVTQMATSAFGSSL